MLSDFLHESGIIRGGGIPQSMIEVANNQFPIIESDKLMKKGDGIAATGNADEVTTIGRKIRDEVPWLEQ